MTATVFGIFDDYGIVQKVIDELHHYGIEDRKIEVHGSDQEAAHTLRDEVIPRDTVPRIAQFIFGGGAIGAIFAFLVYINSAFVHISPWIGVVATFAGFTAGTYIGFLTGAIGKLDLSEDDTNFSEEEMTMGKIWVGVDAEQEDEKFISQKIMHELGAIKLNPEPKNFDEKKLADIGTVVGLTSVIFLGALVVMATIAELIVTPVIGPLQRTVMFVCFLGLLLGSVATAIAGLRTRGARKWLQFDVDGALRDPSEMKNKSPYDEFKKDDSVIKAKGADEALLTLHSSEEEQLKKRPDD
jgi:hypothetical protein